jgi:hypothetical protein
MEALWIIGIIIFLIIIISNSSKRKKEEAARQQRIAEKAQREKAQREKAQREKVQKEKERRLEEQKLEEQRLEEQRLEKQRLEKQRLEELKYETVTVVFAYIEEDGKPNAIIKRSNNTYAFVERPGNPPYSPYIINESLKLLRERTNTWNWVDEHEYRRRESQKRQIAIQLQEQKQKAEQQRLHQLYAAYKDNWQDFQRVLQENGITKLYHFTDRANLSSIKKHGGLYSWDYCQRNNITIPRPGGDQLSWSLDQNKGLQNYVRVSFVKDHPMMFVKQKEGKIVDPVILEINIDVIYKKETKFAAQNAAKNGVIVDASFEKFNDIRFPLLKKRYFDLDSAEKPFYQAEVLVLEKIPLEYILNILNIKDI